jgi:hypothetical protein
MFKRLLEMFLNFLEQSKPKPKVIDNEEQFKQAIDNFHQQIVSTESFDPNAHPELLEEEEKLQPKDYIEAAELLNCEVACIKAVCEVESQGGGFLPSGRAKILFESHLFGKLTNYKYNQTYPNISTSKWDRTTYKGGEKEYDRLQIAIELDKQAALKSASWGMFQILGSNFAACKHKTVEEFVNDQQISERRQLIAFVNFLKTNRIDQYLISKDWNKFAEKYNGPGYLQNSYHTKLQNAYNKHKDR